MNRSLEDKLISLLTGIMSDGLNRSLGALEDAGAVDLTEFRSKYTGIGSEYYDVVTSALEMSAEYSRGAIREVIESSELE